MEGALALSKEAGGLIVGGLNSISSLVGGYYGGRAQAYNIRSQGYYQSAQLYNQSIPVYQQIGNQVRSSIEAQASAQMMSGVDITQGTAAYIRQHNMEQANDKINEVYENVNYQVENINKMAKYSAKSAIRLGLLQGISGAASEMTKALFDTNLYSGSSGSSLFNTNTNTNTNLYDTVKDSFSSKLNVGTKDLSLNLY